MKRCPVCRRVYDHKAETCQVDGTPLGQTGASADALIGQMITSRYRVSRRLGGSSLGTVYLAEEVATRNPVAIKVLLTEVRRDVELVKQFWWEARLAAASSPTRVVRVYEVDRTDEGRVFIAMEYLEGESLAEVIRREGALDVQRALGLAIQIAEGLAAASQAGVTHRNLKPQNVIVVGSDQHVKLTDFGVGRLRETALGGRVNGPSLTAPEYIAPEQIKGDDVSFRADIYALGAVLYTMLTGVAPGADDTTVRALRPEVPEAVEQFVMRAMERRPDRRHGGMEEALEGLRALTTLPPAVIPAAIEASPVPVAASEEVASDEPPARPIELTPTELLTLLREDPWHPPFARWTRGVVGHVNRLGVGVWLVGVNGGRRASAGLAGLRPFVELWWAALGVVAGAVATLMSWLALTLWRLLVSTWSRVSLGAWRSRPAAHQRRAGGRATGWAQPTRRPSRRPRS